MPIFEFICSKCGHEFDFLTSSDKKEPDECPSCGATTLEKKLSAFSVSTGTTPKSEKCFSCPNGTCPHAGKG